MTVKDIAKICHEANSAYCETLGDMSQRSWEFAEPWQRDSAVNGVLFKLANPNAPPSAQHDAWLDDKRNSGWKFGPVKDADKKEHPCFVPYEALPEFQKAKDALFCAIVTALRPGVVTEGVETTDKPSIAQEITENKAVRRDTDAIIQRVKALPGSRERSLAITKLQEGVMWMGMDLKRINEALPGSIANPYPNSKDPSNTKIEPTADGLKL